jgi:flagellar protein FliO/FliZ
MRTPPLLRPLGAAVLGCLLLAPAAFAADGENTPLNLPSATPARAASAGSGGPGASSIVRTIVGLAVVIGVIYGLTWVLKQIKSSKSNAASGAGLETLATLPLGTNRTLHLVRAGDEVVLLGAGDGGVTPIRTYSEDEARALGLIEDEAVDLVGRPALTGSLMERLRNRTVIK